MNFLSLKPKILSDRRFGRILKTLSNFLKIKGVSHEVSSLKQNTNKLDIESILQNTKDGEKTVVVSADTDKGADIRKIMETFEEKHPRN